MLLGVGEEVDLTFSLGAATWNANDGRLVSRGSSARFTAPPIGESVTVTAVGSGCTATITFTIIEPNAVVQIRKPDGGIKHTQARPDVGIQTVPYLMPDTVSFYNVEWLEDEVFSTNTGVYALYPNNPTWRGHHPNASVLGCSDTVVTGKGTKTNAVDNLYSGDHGDAAPFAAGSASWPIPWKYQVSAAAMGGTASPLKQIAIATQVVTLAAAASGDQALTITKAGAAGATTVNSATSTY